LERGRSGLFNAAVNMGLPMPVYLVIKNSGLFVSMVLGIVLQGKRYSSIQVLGVIATTLGVISATLALMPAKASQVSADVIDTTTFTYGSLLMIAGVMAMAILNVAQESAFQKYGKHFQEAVFYSNVLGLMTFLFCGNNMHAHVTTWLSYWESFPLMKGLSVSVPSLWLLLLVNIGAQSMMNLSCLKLTTLAGSVGNVIAVTCFRFFCLVLSACVMNSPPYPPLTFWIGGLLVLGGTLSYALAPSASKRSAGKDV